MRRQSFSGRGGRPAKRFDDRPRSGSDQDLLRLLRGIDGSSYGAYKRALGDWNFGSFTVILDRIQSDPYAPPSAARITMSASTAGLPSEAISTSDQQLATADFLARNFHRVLRQSSRFGALSIATPGQEILQRSSCTVTEKSIELRIQIRMPARGRTILGQQAATIFDVAIPDAVGETLDFLSPHAAEYRADLLRHVAAFEDHRALQELVSARGWVSFIADEAMLARRSGISALPLSDGVPFSSPDSLRQTVSLPHAGQVSGMAIPRGITLIAGGGYHGKSTLLSAIESGVYPHIPGDGRELIATVPNAMKIRAADGRPVTRVDVSPFINHLPTGTDTHIFSTQNASGSTSQAASLVEAVQAGTSALLIDEDTSATNLMIRDERMRTLVSAEQEPITPLIDRVQALAKKVSVVMVMGGSGAYLDVADRVLQMDAYHCLDVTDRAHQIAQKLPRHLSAIDEFPPLTPRTPRPLRSPERAKTRSSGLDSITLDKQTIDVSDVEQIVDPGQTEAIAWALRGILFQLADGTKTLSELVSQVEWHIERKGLDALSEYGGRPHPAFLVRPRAIDIIAAANRCRALEIAPVS